MRVFRVGLAVGGALLLPVAGHAWMHRLAGAMDEMLADRRGNVVGFVLRRVRHIHLVPEIRQFSARDGRTKWRYRWPYEADSGGGVERIVAVPEGDVLAAGSVPNGAEHDDFAVVRLSGRSGRPRWKRVVGGAVGKARGESASDVAIAPSGEVVAVGHVADIGDSERSAGYFQAFVLDGDTGAERSRFAIRDAGPGGAFEVEVDAQGFIVASGRLGPGAPDGSRRYSVVKLDGRTGDVVWRQVPNVTDIIDLVLDRNGDVLLAAAGLEDGQVTSDFAVIKLDGSTGVVKWFSRESASTHYEAAIDVITDETGAVFAAGHTNDGTGEPGSSVGDIFMVARYDGDTGAPVWVYRLGGGGEAGFARRLAFGPSSTIIAIGSASAPATCGDAFVVALDRDTGVPRWSQRMDGSFVASDCHAPCYRCRVDDDHFDAIVVDPVRGAVVVSGAVLNGAGATARDVGFIRTLAQAAGAPR